MGGLIWLASYPKSGNTWTRAFLHNLLLNPPSPVSINELGKFNYLDSSMVWFKDLGDKPVNEMSSLEIMQHRAVAQRRITSTSPDSVFVKTHNYMGTRHGIPLHNMEATAGTIYVVRNPLDVTISMSHHFNLSIDDAILRLSDPGTITNMTEKTVPEYHSSWSNHVYSWTRVATPHLLKVRYEDLLDKPLKEFGRIAKYLGLKPPRERLQRAINFSSFKTLKKQEKKTEFRESAKHQDSFFRKGKRDQWREVLTPEQIKLIIHYHGEQMERFGYIPEDYA